MRRRIATLAGLLLVALSAAGAQTPTPVEVAVPMRDGQLLVGPWTHVAESRVEQGELLYPAAVGVAAAHVLAWFDLHLRGLGAGPPGPSAQWFEMGRDRWRGAASWPPAEVAEVVWHLLPGGRLAPEAPPEGDPLAAWSGDPTDPSPTWGGPRSGPNLLDGPVDLATHVEGRGDLLIFTSEPLAQPLPLLGALRLEASFSSDRLDTDLVVRLTDVYPDGRSMLVADGVRRARFRGGYESEQLLTPGEITNVAVDLSPTGLTLLPGHRLRLDVTASNYPRLHVNPNDGGPLYQPGATPLVAHNALHLGALAPTVLRLPVGSAMPFDDDFESGDLRAWRVVTTTVR